MNDDLKSSKEHRIYHAIETRKFMKSLVKKAKDLVKEVRMFYVPKRDARNLLPIIKSNCNVGSEIVSDEWRAYRLILF